MLLLVAMLGCTSSYDCDLRIRDLYPNDTVQVLDVASGISVYKIEDLYVSCISGDGSPLSIEALALRTWVNAHCSRSSNPKICMEQQKKKDAEK